ncbi:hypothetical protein [Asticcacaulis sp.]|uniref:hypothetical protein n=1 Tax=Asticcacaulis sp. TaxID=1872648 RepID=UPI00261C474C|nr:hypothetical protein [Asticcacaulis sp.]
MEPLTRSELVAQARASVKWAGIYRRQGDRANCAFLLQMAATARKTAGACHGPQ